MCSSTSGGRAPVAAVGAARRTCSCPQRVSTNARRDSIAVAPVARAHRPRSRVAGHRAGRRAHVAVPLVDLQQVAVRVPREQERRGPPRAARARDLAGPRVAQHRCAGRPHPRVDCREVLDLEHQDRIARREAVRRRRHGTRLAVLQQPDHAEPRMPPLHDREPRRRAGRGAGRQAVGAHPAVVAQPDGVAEHVAVEADRRLEVVDHERRAADDGGLGRRGVAGRRRQECESQQQRDRATPNRCERPRFADPANRRHRAASTPARRRPERKRRHRRRCRRRSRQRWAGDAPAPPPLTSARRSPCDAARRGGSAHVPRASRCPRSAGTRRSPPSSSASRRRRAPTGTRRPRPRGAPRGPG